MSIQNNKVLVTGATGTIGSRLLQSLHEKGIPAVGATRNPSEANKHWPQFSFVHFDFTSPESYETALVGVDRVFLLGPPLELQLENLLKPFIDFLNDKGIKRVVYISALGLEKIPNMPFHANLIQYMKSKSFDLTVLKPSFFAQNFKNYEKDAILHQQVLFQVAGNGKAAFIDANDIARSAAAALADPQHIGKEYALTGPDLYSYADVASILSEVLNKPIQYVNPSPELYKETLAKAGAPSFIADYMIQVYSLIANNQVAEIHSDVEKLTGQKPNSLAAVLKAEFAQ